MGVVAVKHEIAVADLITVSRSNTNPKPRGRKCCQRKSITSKTKLEGEACCWDCQQIGARSMGMFCQCLMSRVALSKAQRLGFKSRLSELARK